MFDIVMSLYNKAKFVEATIEAVLAQSYPDWRLFVVDDGSTDEGPELAAQFKDQRIAIIRQTNQGVGPARNTGILAGSAPWIALLDADDVWNADHLAGLDRLCCEFPEAVLIGTGFQRFSGAVERRTLSAGDKSRRLARYFAECAQGEELFFTSSAAVRRSAIEQVGGFEPLPGNEDVELWARLALHGPVAVSGLRTVNYRVDSGGITEQGMGGRKPELKPLKRDELSSAIPPLERALPSITDSQLREDVLTYIDSRIGVRMTVAVIEGDVGYARHLRSLYRGKPLGKARIAARIAKLPRPLAKAIVAGGLGIKRRLRRR